MTNKTKCSYDPTVMKGAAIGMYHCPECGEMVLAGVKHPDYPLFENAGDLVDSLIEELAFLQECERRVRLQIEQVKAQIKQLTNPE